MVDDVHRTAITIPGSGAVIEVPDEQLDERVAGGWKKVRASRRADTGSVPTQQAQPGTATPVPTSNR